MDTQRIPIFLTRHAGEDSVPLRFGIIPRQWRGRLEVEKILKTEGNGKEQISGCLILQDGVEIPRGCFVLAPFDPDYGNRSVITVLPSEKQETSSKVSNAIRGYREGHIIDSRFIAQNLHPLYRDGKLRNFEDLVKALDDFGIKSDISEAKKLARGIDRQISENDKKRSANEIENKARMVEARTIVRQRPDYDGSEIDISPIYTLLDIRADARINRRGETVKCTRLIFEEEQAIERLMDQWADPDGTITREAHKLIGQPVFTTVWQPEIYDNLKWWRSIHAAVELESDR